MDNRKDIQSYLDFAEKALYKAGDVLLSHRDNFSIKKTKDVLKLDIATSADYAAEESIVNDIKEHFPDHSILTEETAGVTNNSDYLWIIDPLDGTKEYTRRSPYFYTLLALQYKDKFIVGTGYQPEIKRLFSAGEGIGTLINGKTTHLSTETHVSKSFISIALPYMGMQPKWLEPYLNVIRNLAGKCYRLRNTAWDVEALFHVATGMIEGYILPPHETGRGPKLWDIAPGIASVQASGGTITDFYGNSLINGKNEMGIVATNGSIHKELLYLLKNSYSLV